MEGHLRQEQTKLKKEYEETYDFRIHRYPNISVYSEVSLSISDDWLFFT